MSDNSCPCQSNNSYNECCQPYHLGVSKPDTAEQLMRSRYTAYYYRLVDYLVITTHPDKLKRSYRAELTRSIGDTEWTGLTILSTSVGTKKDKIGKVEFVASYEMNGKSDSMQEHSRFRRYKGDWVYYDGKG